MPLPTSRPAPPPVPPPPPAHALEAEDQSRTYGQTGQVRQARRVPGCQPCANTFVRLPGKPARTPSFALPVDRVAAPYRDRLGTELENWPAYRWFLWRRGSAASLGDDPLPSGR